jgi:hypothetical protein
VKAGNLISLQNMTCSVVIAISVSACTDQCENKQLAAVEAPDFKAIAVLFERNCGATTPFLRIVTITEREKPPDFDNSGRWVMISEGQSRFDLSWNGNLELKVSIIDVAKITMKKETFENIRISFGYGPRD